MRLGPVPTSTTSSSYLNYSKAHYEHYADLLDAYADFCLVDEETEYPVAVANCVPFACSGSDDLPPEG